MRLGVRRPRRDLVRFVDDEFEGREEWVPPARLKVPWQRVDEFVARERRWDAVTSATPMDDPPEMSAARIVFDLLVEPKSATLGYNATDGVIKVHDVDGLAGFLGLDPAEFRTDPTAFEEDGDFIASWTITRQVARRGAERDPHKVLAHIEREEADARQEAIFGRSYPKRGKAEAWHVSPEICAQIDEEHRRPVRAILREWAGREPADLRNEVAAYRSEASRLAGLAEAALSVLRQAGLIRQANALERKHGNVEGGLRPER